MTDEKAAEIICRVANGEKHSKTEFGAALEYLSTKGISGYKDAIIWAKKRKRRMPKNGGRQFEDRWKK